MNFLSELTGSFSQNSASNPTVEMVEAAYRHHKLDYRYINCEITPEQLADAVKGARAMSWAGFNCSQPHKVEVIKYLDGLGESAALMGAVNCVVRRDGKYIGENTDGKGFLESLKIVVDPKDKNIVILGAGGAARAIAIELALAGATEITIANRDSNRGNELVDLINGKTKTKGHFFKWDSPFKVPSNIDILVNATSVGMAPHDDERINLDVESLRANLVVADVIVNPPNTHLLSDAKAKGCKVIGGLGMIVNQGILGVKYWTGITADAGVMRDALAKVL
ncbi:MAG: shikimate dehydrogenase [Actinomycetales bacterium]|jgi:shikimate dehydrogenase|nr:MAG: shikimate dehydrogenase [Actinomycetales bacterium]